MERFVHRGKDGRILDVDEFQVAKALLAGEVELLSQEVDSKHLRPVPPVRPPEHCRGDDFVWSARLRFQGSPQLAASCFCTCRGSRRLQLFWVQLSALGCMQGVQLGGSGG